MAFTLSSLFISATGLAHQSNRLLDQILQQIIDIHNPGSGSAWGGDCVEIRSRTAPSTIKSLEIS